MHANRSGSHTQLYHKQNTGSQSDVGFGGYVDAHNRNTEWDDSQRVQVGGERYNYNFEDAGRGAMSVSRGTSCNDGAHPSNMNAAMHGGGKYSYATTGGEGDGAYSSFVGGDNLGDFKGMYAPTRVMPRNQCGGGSKSVCHSISKINNFSQVYPFWRRLCPHSISLYKKHVSKKVHSHKREVVRFLRHCTRCLCKLLEGMRASTYAKRQKCLSACKGHLRKAQKALRDMGSRGSTKSISNMCSKLLRKQTKKRRKKRTRRRRRRRGRTTRRQRGGYSQYGNNVANTPSYSTPGGAAPYGAAASPPTRTETNNCRDNYNHYKN